MTNTLVFMDSGFLSKLSKYLGSGKYLNYDIIAFSELLARKENLNCNQIFYYTAPPFQSTPSTTNQKQRKNKYDIFIKKISENKKIIIRKGRCQRIINKRGFVKYNQKAVDTLMVMDLMSIPLKYKEIKKIILIACDSDFVPVIEQLKNYGIQVVLYTYFTKRRNTNFSRSTHLMKIASKYAKLAKEDFCRCPLNSKEK